MGILEDAKEVASAEMRKRTTARVADLDYCRDESEAESDDDKYGAVLMTPLGEGIVCVVIWSILAMFYVSTLF